MTQCPSCGEENPERARFCLACGRRLEEVAPAAEQRKPVTVVFSDVVDSTAMGEELDSEAVRAMMLRYFDVMSAVVARHGGTVEKFIGDAVMAVFGLPQVHEDDALRAVRAAADMREELARLNADLQAAWGRTLQIRIGVNSGEVMAGLPDDATLVTGDCVNLAARLEQAAAPGEILLGSSTHQLVRDAVVAEQAPPLTVKGKAEPVVCWRLREVIAGALGHARRFDTAFVGRAAERSLLDWAFERVARERTCHLVTVLGAAGVGKSRLVAEFLEGLGQRAKIVTGRCLPYGEGITFWPVAEIVRQATGITETASATEASARLRDALGSEEGARQVADQLAGLIGLGHRSSGDPAWAVRKGLEALARHRPVVIVVEDLHWAEPTLLDLVEHVAEWSRDAPILVLAVARPELLDRRPDWGGGKVNATSILLEPLQEDDARTLLDTLAGDAPLDDTARGHLVRTSAGNPLFLEELLAMLTDEGWLVGGEAARVEELPLPATIQGLIAARLEGVDPPERDLLDRASVVGEVFELAAAVALTPADQQADVPRRVRALVRKELLRIERSIGEEVFAFRHLLVRDAVYAALPKQARAELHERVADLLSARADSRTGEYDELVGYHLQQAVHHREDVRQDDPAIAVLAARAAQHLAVGGRRALARGDMPATVSLLQRATDLLPAVDPQRAALLIDLARAMTEMGDAPAATKALDDAAAAVDAGGDRALRIRVDLSRLELASNVDLSGWAAAASAEVERAIPVLTELGDDLGLAQAWGLLGEVRYLRGAIAASEEAFRRHGDHGRRAGGTREETETAAGLAWTAVEGPLPVAEAVARCGETLRRFAGHRSVEARVWRALALLRAMDGQFAEAGALVERSRDAFTDLGQRYWLAATDEVAGRVAWLAGDRAGAERAFRAALEKFERIGDATYLPMVLAGLSIVLADDAAEEAALLAERSRAAAEPDDVVAATLWRLSDAHRHRRAGDLASAGEAARAAVALTDGTDLLNLQGDALGTLGGLQAGAGADPAAARGNLVSALDCYERKGNVVAAQRVRDDLATLAGVRP